MSNAPTTDTQKRDELRAKIEAGESRNADRSLSEQARAVADDAVAFVKANPLKSVAAVAVGALLVGAMTRPGRRAGRKAGAMAGVATEAALAYGLGLLEAASGAASKGQDSLAEFGDTVGHKARTWQASAAREGANLSDQLVRAAKRGGDRAGRTIEELRSRLSR